MRLKSLDGITVMAQAELIRRSSPQNKAKRLQRKQALLIVGGRVLLLVCVLTVWQLLSGRVVDPLFISSPLAIGQQISAWISDGTLLFHTEITLQETLLGLFFGTVAGILAGFVLGIQQVLGKILDPFVIAFYSIPKIALAPLFILWFGIDIQMKVILAAVTVFFLVFLNTLAGVRDVDQDLINAVLLMGGKSRDITFKVIVPATTGSILTGLRIAVPYALIGAIVGELIASNRGIGYLILSTGAEYNTAGLFAAILVLTIIASLLNALVNLIDRKTSRWKTRASIGRKILP
ncbi:MAG: ABC transporter permease [Ktedonobacteraceae bacterium]